MSKKRLNVIEAKIDAICAKLGIDTKVIAKSIGGGGVKPPKDDDDDDDNVDP